MKLKYYLRGLGIGILLATILLSIGSDKRTSNGKEQLSDQEIMDRAKGLGMVMKEDKDLEEMLAGVKTADKAPSLSDKPVDTTGETTVDEASSDETGSDDIKDKSDDMIGEASSDTTGENSQSMTGEASSDTTGENSQSMAGEASSDTTGENSQSMTGEASGDISGEASREASGEASDDSGVPSDGTVTFTVIKGMSSGMVAKLLNEKGLVEDADGFNEYIMKEGKASVIRIGTYTLPADASYRMIVDAITK